MKLNKLERAWAYYDWANSAYTLIVMTVIFPLYFKGIATELGIKAHESTAMIGFANSAATFIVAILAPFLGTLADYYGYKKRMFLIFLGLGVTFTFALGIIPGHLIYTVLSFYVITAVGFAGANIFYDSFLVDITVDEKMDKLSTFGYAVGYIGSTIPFIIIMAIMMLAESGKLPFGVSRAVQIAFMLTAMWWFVFSIPMIRQVKQIHGIPREKNPFVNSLKRLWSTIKDIKSYKPAFMFLGAYFFYIDGVDTIIKMATSFGSDIGVSEVNLLVILLVTQFVAFPSALIYGRLADRFNAKTMIMVSIFAYIGITAFATVMSTTLHFWIVAMVVGMFQGGIQAISRSYFAKLIPKHKSNEFFGLFNIFGKFAAIMGPAMIGFVTLYTKSTSKAALSIMALFIIGGIILSRVKVEE